MTVPNKVTIEITVESIKTVVWEDSKQIAELSWSRAGTTRWLGGKKDWVDLLNEQLPDDCEGELNSLAESLEEIDLFDVAHELTYLQDNISFDTDFNGENNDTE